MPLDTSSFGLPVELPKVSAQLKKLWETEGQTKSRASILNFAVIGQSADKLAENTQLISQLVREHACRAFVVGTAPGAHPTISAWIQAHCHLTKAGARQICSEQVTLLAEGCSEEAYAHALLSHLDYDLPLTLWWQGELPEQPRSALWPAVDRLIFDSGEWSNFSQQLTALHRTRQGHSRGMIWADLNWTRTLAMRQALAQCYDTPDCLPHLSQIKTVRIEHSPESQRTALLLGCWLAAQLGWTATESSHSHVDFRSRSSAPVRLELRAKPGAPLSSIFLESSDFQIFVSRHSGTSLLRADIRKNNILVRESSFSAGPADVLGLLSAEMIPGSRHPVYQRALSIAQAIPGQIFRAP